jgi:CubicO group peptidase (beta-lactamase class C family)
MTLRVYSPYFAGDFGFAWTPRQLIAIADSHGPGPAPGTAQEYSNSNYTLLGLVPPRSSLQ